MIEFKEVEKRYPNGFEALKHINLTIDQGEFVAIIGLSGAGKSTLIRTINRMHDITQGQLTVDGTDVMTLHGKNLRKFRRRIGMIFQSFNLITRTTVIKNVLTAFVPDLPWWRATFGIFTKEEKMKALEALDQMGILDKAFVRADQLSGGQQQRVALARTLAQNPQIILADEPVASLDPVTAKQVMDDFQRINRDMHITVLINIHHVELALQYATRVIGIRAGEIVYDGPANQVDQAVLDAAYDRAADAICEKLDQGKDVAFITLGDPTVYSTYIYIHRRVVNRGYGAEIIPGVPSFCAVAARLGEPLCEKAQRLMIVPASHGEVEDCLSVDANLVFMKAGRELGALRDTLAAHGLLERASMVANCGMEGETVCPRFADVPEGTGYFSVVLVKKGEPT